MWVAHAPGIPGMFPRHRFQRKPLVIDPGVRHARASGACQDRLPAEAGKTFPAFPAHAQPAILRIWQEAHEFDYNAWMAIIWWYDWVWLRNYMHTHCLLYHISDFLNLWGMSSQVVHLGDIIFYCRNYVLSCMKVIWPKWLDIVIADRRESRTLGTKLLHKTQSKGYVYGSKFILPISLLLNSPAIGAHAQVKTP